MAEAEFIPNYKRKCVVCGQTPTVDIKSVETGTIVDSTDMCGVCTWGEADCLDPDNW